MLDFKEFVSKPKSMLIAPAGHGKTHTIVECLKHTTGKQLILTHTHAGVASIKEKIKKANIPNSNYNVETITSFAQKYVLAFYTGIDIPDQENGKKYYPFIIEKATSFFKLQSILSIVSVTYTGLFVDEYQDCNEQQHKLIVALSEILPTRILGDFLQGIFNFTGNPLVNMEKQDSIGDFYSNRYELTEPWRWINGKNEILGNDLKEIRAKLICNELIDLSKYQGVEVIKVAESDMFDAEKDYHKQIRKLTNLNSLLLIHPDSTSTNPRLKVIMTYNKIFSMIEAIDDKDFYKLAKQVDTINKSNYVSIIIGISRELFSKTVIDNWFNDTGLKNKRDESEKQKSLIIQRELQKFDEFGLISQVERKK